ncbi:MAG TPA: hypothetical protein VLB76_05305 [Thermoanaerobaculia bacterium]|jgi:hypothetical protein|nr:hypothetical protein [Thermoanaerobaculia bacterium]
MSLTMLDLSGEGQRATYSQEPVPPLRKIWIGFAFAFAFLVGEGVYLAAGESPAAKLGPLMAAFAGWFYWLACVQRFHTILNRISPRVAGAPTYPITPSQAVGYHFIPFFNLFWLFKWPMVLSKYLRENTSVRMVPGALLGLLGFLGLLLRVVDGFLGLSVMFCVAFYISRKLREAVAEYESLRDASEVFA